MKGAQPTARTFLTPDKARYRWRRGCTGAGREECGWSELGWFWPLGLRLGLGWVEASGASVQGAIGRRSGSAVQSFALASGLPYMSTDNRSLRSLEVKSQSA